MASAAGRYSCRVSRLRNRKGPESGALSLGSSARPLFGSTSEHEALIDEAVALFSRESERTISREEARQMTERLVAYFELLMEWSNLAESPDKS